MHQALSETAILLSLSVIAVVLFRRIKLPPILAYLAVGILLGPHALGIVSESDAMHFLAEVGVSFLLFTLGLEFSLPKLIANRRAVVGLGSAQVTLTILLAGGISWLAGSGMEAAIVVGSILALSSTAVVIKLLAEQLELESRHGTLSVSVLLFQDIAVVPMLVIIPAMAGDTSGDIFYYKLVLSFAEGILVTVVMLAIGHWLLRPVFREVAAAHSPELFTLAVLLVALIASLATRSAGLSMALGAFLAGMMLSETEFKHQIETDIRPFRDVLLGLFFITVGMQLDVTVLPDIWPWVLLVTLGIVLVKTLVTMGLSRLIMGVQAGVALRTGLVLAQGGEFGFALLSIAIAGRILEPAVAQIVLAAIIFSMVLTPFLVRYNGHMAKLIFSRSYLGNREAQQEDIQQQAAPLQQHVIICGFGRIGQNIARLIQQEDIPYFALDYHFKLLQEARKAGFNVHFGDTTHKQILQAAGIQRAAVAIICHDDIATTRKTLKQIKAIKPELPVLVRTADESYYETLQEDGATEVVPETLESSLILASQLLSLMGIPMARIVRRIQALRNENYASLRQFFQSDEAVNIEQPESSRKRLTSLTLPEGAHAIGKTLEELQLDQYGVSIQTNRRNDDHEHINSDGRSLKAGDVLVLFGTPENLEHAENILLSG